MTKKLREIFSDRLREGLKKSSMSQRELARKLEISPATVQRWIQETNTPSLEVIEEIAIVLNVEAAWLMGGEKRNMSRAENILESIKILNSIQDHGLAKKALEAILEGEFLEEESRRKKFASEK